MTIKKDIIYPIFLECSQFITDKFWENIFEDLAYGKSPYGTYISKGSLTCKYKDKEFIYKLEKKDPKILYTEIYLLLTNWNIIIIIFFIIASLVLNHPHSSQRT